jgi:Zn-dependent protease/predicted transcriptional regulator
MRDKHISLGKITGIPVNLDYSWFLILALLTWMLAQSYFPQEFKNWPVLFYWLAGFITSLLFFLSILLHELGHSLIARKYNVKVKRITLFIFGGVAEITSEPPKSISEFWIAIAGPITSFLLAGIFYLLELAAAGDDYLVAPFRYLAFINFILAAFNLIPGFPLDGGRVLRSIIWGITKNLKKATTIAANVGRFFGFFFIMLGVFQIFQNNFIDGVWIAFIGWFLESAAISQIQRQALDELLFGHKVYEAMSTDYGIVYPDSTIQEIIDNHFIGANRRNLFVKDNDTFTGFLTPKQIHSIPLRERQNRTVKDVMISFESITGVNSGTALLDALKTIEQSDLKVVPVTEDGNYVGILDHDGIIKFILNLHKLGH